MEALYPAEGYIGERLSTSERSRIIEALGTLTEDLERGKSLERYVDGVWKFKWNGTDPGVHFSPVIRRKQEFRRFLIICMSADGPSLDN